MADFRTAWVVLQITRKGRTTACAYLDGYLREKRFSFEQSADALSAPSEIAGFISQFIESLPRSRPGIRNDGPVPLPVFVRIVGSEVDRGPWNALIKSMRFKGVEPGRLQFVHLTASSTRPKSPFQLPFRVLTLGSRAKYGLLPLLGRPWLASSMQLRQDGINVTEASIETLRSKMGKTRYDVMFLPGQDSKPVYEVLSDLGLSYRPRLVVDRSAEVDSVPEGVSILHAPGTVGASRLGTEILFGLIHDLPLHETLNAVVRKLKPATEFTLYSNPTDNNALRISDAFLSLRQEAMRVHSYISGIRPEVLAATAGIPTGLSRAFSRGGGKALRLPSSTVKVLTGAADFTHESTGLKPLVLAQKGLQTTKIDFSKFAAQLRRVQYDRESIKFLRKEQKRVVDASLERLETAPYLSAVEPEWSLQAGARYQLLVHVGNRLPGSLAKGVVPGIDALLPPSRKPQGHKLDIAVQQKEFTLLSDWQHSVFLPRFGGSQRVRFSVQAPRKNGPATLRVLVYHRNQLLQTFLLRTQITDSEKRGTKDQTEFRLEFSRTRRFANLGQFRPRALSIAVNDNLNGTHDIFLKGKKVGRVPLGDDAYVQAMGDIRAILKEASIEDGTADTERIYPAVQPGRPAGPAGDGFIRRLANKGHELFSALFRNLPKQTPLPTDIRALRDKSGATIQIARLQERLVFPWSVLYDYELPETRTGEVCLGQTTDAEGKLVPCKHTAQSRAYCINGFWGVRHIVEEVIGKDREDDAVFSIPKPKDSEPMCVAMDVGVDGVTDLQTQLTKELGEGSVAGPLDARHLVDLLWQEPPKRPSVLLVLGHLETRAPTIVGEPATERIVVGARSWLTHESISDRFNAAACHWEQPRPLVLLMACAAATTTVEKLNDFVLALNAAGAGAIVGTECVVFADLVCSFAKSLTLRMWKADAKGKHVSLGRAMNEYRVETLRQGNPLAFVFRSIGEADLVLET